jgi:hypothetical protein
VRDVRLRDALRALRDGGRLPQAPAQALADDVDLAEDAHVALQHDSAVVAERLCSELEHAVAALEGRAQFAGRVMRRLRRSTPGGDG